MPLQIIPAFPSRYIDPRQVEIWFPPSYEIGLNRRYPVLYMQDGQNVFNPATSMHKVPWGVDEALSRLIAENKVRETIVVAIWNNPSKRWAEYMPEKALSFAPAHQAAQFIAQNGPPLADNYVRFLVRELKPFIDSTFYTLPGQGDTLIMGSSMGGLISLYALCEFPQVFGGAACLSTHWVAGEGIVQVYLKEALPPPGQHKIYFDYGTIGLDADYEPYQMQMNKIMLAAGYPPGMWITEKFPDADHNEAAWRERVHIPLAFLLEN